MRIALVGPFPPFRGGIADLNSALADHLSQQHEVTAFNFTTQYPNAFFPGKTQFKPDPPTYDFPSIRCLSSVNPRTWGQTADQILKTEPDIVLFRYWMPFFAPAFSGVAKRIKKKSDSRIIAICDNIIPHEHRLFDQQLTHRFLNQMDAFIVLSKKVESELLRFLPNAHYVYTPHPIYNIFKVNTSKEQAKAKLNISEKNVLLFFGLIREYKGLDILIEAVGNLKSDLDDFKLLIVGECYKDEQLYIDLIDQAGIAGQVQCHFNFVPDDEVGTYFIAADVVVLPYKTASQSGIVQIAYHFDTPVIVSNVGGLPEIVDQGKTGYCVELTATAFAAAINTFFSTRIHDAMSSNIVQYKSRFSWTEIVKKIEELADGD